MPSAIKVSNAYKKYDDFHLKNVNFEVKKGTIMGLIGENGAGKTTLINAILNIIQLDQGEIKLFGESPSYNLNNDIGVVFDADNFPLYLNAHQISKIYQRVYQNWDQNLFDTYMNLFSLPYHKQIKHFSRGMKMKLALIMALSHHPKLLILDEATSGLDPVAREEILDVFLDFMQDENNSILISSHITSDLEKIADYLTFIQNGECYFSIPMMDLNDQYGLAIMTKKDLEKLNKDEMLAYLHRDHATEVIVKNRDDFAYQYPHISISKISIDQVMNIYSKGVIL